MERVKFLYLQDPTEPRRRVTVARQLDPKTNILRFSYAMSNPIDNFSKEIGRKIATGRLEKGVRTFELILDEGERAISTVVAVLSVNGSDRLRKIAKWHKENGK